MVETLRDRRLRYVRSIPESRSTSRALFGQTSGLDGQRVLVLGTHPTETLCALVHTECRTAEARLPDAHSEARSADLVLVPHVTVVTLGQIVAQAARSLVHDGRIILAVDTHERSLVSTATRALSNAGFKALYARVDGEETRIYAQQQGLEAFRN